MNGKNDEYDGNKM